MLSNTLLNPSGDSLKANLIEFLLSLYDKLLQDADYAASRFHVFHGTCPITKIL